MKKLYLGIDIGTTHLKVCAVDARGRCLAVAERDQELTPDPVFGDSIPAELLFTRCADCIREVSETVDRAQIAAIGITSMAEAGIPVNAGGEALMPLIPWNQKGLGSQRPDFLVSVTDWALYQRTGLCWHPKYTINRIWQMRRQQEALYAETDCFLSVSDYILYRLTGQKLTDESLACRTMLYNIHEQCWDRSLQPLRACRTSCPP